jgi:hypothetical protein
MPIAGHVHCDVVAPADAQIDARLDAGAMFRPEPER